MAIASSYLHNIIDLQTPSGNYITDHHTSVGQHLIDQELMSRRRRRRSMKLTQPAGCHHNPN